MYQLVVEKRHGSGEEWVTTAPQIRNALNNVLITHKEATDFMDSYPLYAQCPKYRVFFVPERTKMYGRCSPQAKEILLARRSVNVFLHEFAHVIAIHVYKERGHGPKFGRAMDELIVAWQNRNQ